MGIVNTVRVLPSHPILVAEAVEYDMGAAAEFTVIEPEAIGVAVADGEVFLADAHWVEAPEPIVWDGSDETLAAIKGDGLGGCWKGDGYKLWPVPDMEWEILLPDERSGWSVVPTSSGPVILPPEEVSE